MAELHYSLMHIDQQWCAMVKGSPARCFEDRDLALSKVSKLVARAVACGHVADLTIEEPLAEARPA